MEINEYNDNLHFEENFNDSFINVFLENITNELIKFFGSNISFTNKIKEIIENSKDINKTITNISEKFGQILNNFNLEKIEKSKKFIFNEKDELNILEKKLQNEKDLDLANADLEEKNNNKTFEDIGLSFSEKKTFNKIINKLGLKKLINVIMNRRLKEKVNKKFGTSKGRYRQNVVVPDSNGNNYQYYFNFTYFNQIYIDCADKNCHAKGKMDKNTLTFILTTPHDKPFLEHSYLKNKFN